MRKYWIYILTLSLAGCAGGGFDSGNDSNNQSQVATDSLIEFVPYETLRNNLISSLYLTENSDCIERLDDNASVFGAFTPGSGRNLGFNITRFRVMADVANECCVEAIQNNRDRIFSAADPVAPDTIFRAVVGRKISDDERNALKVDLMALEGYESTVDRQQAICVAVLNSLAAQMK